MKPENRRLPEFTKSFEAPLLGFCGLLLLALTFGGWVILAVLAREGAEYSAGTGILFGVAGVVGGFASGCMIARGFKRRD